MTALTFSDRVLDKAHRYRVEDRVHPASDDGEVSTWVVEGSTDTYAVTITAEHDHSTCSCPHGRHREGAAATCSHVAAVLLTIRGE